MIGIRDIFARTVKCLVRASTHHALLPRMVAPPCPQAKWKCEQLFKDSDRYLHVVNLLQAHAPLYVLEGKVFEERTQV